MALEVPVYAVAQTPLGAADGAGRLRAVYPLHLAAALLLFAAFGVYLNQVSKVAQRPGKGCLVVAFRTGR